MLFPVVAVFLSVLVGIDSDLAPCRLANDVVDEVLNQTNFHANADSHDALEVEGFNQKVSLSLFGFHLWNVYLELNDGSVYSLATLSRSGDVKECTNATHKSLEGTFTYDTMQITFNSMKASLLFWEISGKFTYKFKPFIDVIFTQTNLDCGPGPLDLRRTIDAEYEIVADHSWTSWLVSKAIHYSLKNGDTSSMISSFIQRSWVSIDCYFGLYYCA
uniref:GDP-D-glucose phosphorylase C15orf58 n=1 Tax=Lygus hesperus TaxID=30085 RepID=A0A0A9YZL1_LYGHE